jgi:hypothetical protein
MAACDQGFGSSGSNTDPKTITITGIPNTITRPSGTHWPLDVDIMIRNNYWTIIATGSGNISGGSVTISLMIPVYESTSPFENEPSNVPWTGSGSFFIELQIYYYINDYIYSAGKTWAELGINPRYSTVDDLAKIPKYNITSASTTIAFSQFQYWDTSTM